MADSFSTPFQLQAGRHCKRILQGNRGCFLIDGADYFGDLASRLRSARRLVWIIGWDLHSRMILARDPLEKEAHTLGDYLETLLNRQSDLHIYILVWHSPFLFGIQREKLLAVRLGLTSHPRLHFAFDEELPVGASHHQKLVVIDNCTAYCGGIDLTGGRWDTSAHQHNEPGRRDPDGKPYGPFHDCMIRVDGEVAADLGDMARERWERALTGEEPIDLDRHVPFSDSNVSWDFENAALGIVRTYPAYKDQLEIRETEATYLDMIHSARELIYIENQYFTYQPVMEALRERLQDPNGPTVIAVVSVADHGWLEKNTMGLLLDYWASVLSQVDPGGRFGVFHPIVPGMDAEQYTTHIKVMIIDNQAILVGSANLNGRSMGLDTECGLVMVAGDRDDIKSCIEKMRTRLVIEHLGLKEQDPALNLPTGQALLKMIHSHEGRGRCLGSHPIKDLEEIGRTVAESGHLDPDNPLAAERMADHMNRQTRLIRRRVFSNPLFIPGILMGVIIACYALWMAVSLPLGIPETIKEPFLSHPWTSVVVFGVYLLASVFLIPVLLLILATAILFPVPWACFYALTGSLGNATLGYVVGRLLGEAWFKKHIATSVSKRSRYLNKEGFLAFLLLRMIPFAPFSTVNYLCGAYGFKFGPYLAGTALGMIPVTTAIILFAKSLVIWLNDFSLGSGLVFAMAVMVLAGSVYWLKHRFLD
jgi:phosphatidylserine/phosphatidylglycerophosphate/cardiolipin synthase-like enzyme/uncharacterized membrane protein YdjX (TVP38/TMEM64 family)